MFLIWPLRLIKAIKAKITSAIVIQTYLKIQFIFDPTSDVKVETRKNQHSVAVQTARKLQRFATGRSAVGRKKSCQVQNSIDDVEGHQRMVWMAFRLFVRRKSVVFHHFVPFVV